MPSLRLCGANALFAISLLFLTLPLVSCWGENGNRSELDWELRAIIAERGLTGDPTLGRDLPQITDPIAQLGMKLFFSKALSGDNDVACASCHHPELGGGDALSLSIGVGADVPDLLGPGRTHPDGVFIPRNAPTTLNVGLWDQVMFHDGRVESIGKEPGLNGGGDQGIRTPDSAFGAADPGAGQDLAAAQSRFPVTSAAEMRGERFEVVGHLNSTVRANLAAKIGGYGRYNELPHNEWLSEFQHAFDSSAGAEALVTEANIFHAIGEYERSQVFVDTPWKAYVAGDDDAISEAAKRGALLFFSSIEAGGADCARCHSGDFFTDEQFHVLAIPQIGPGKGDGPAGDDDLGRFRATGDPADLYAFRTPTLLNVEVTGPYGHNGAYLTLEGIIRHHLDPAAAVAQYDANLLDPAIATHNIASNTQKALSQLEENRALGLSVIEPVNLTDAQIAEIISFLLALTDPCVKEPDCLALWLPAGLDPDGLRLQRSAQ